jgi:hypothetical protein
VCDNCVTDFGKSHSQKLQFVKSFFEEKKVVKK